MSSYINVRESLSLTSLPTLPKIGTENKPLS